MNALASYRRLLRNRALARVLAGEFVSGIGDWLYQVALLIIVYAETRSALLLGIVGAARLVPFVVLSIPAGWVADHFDRRLILISTDVGRGLLQIVLAALVLGNAPILAIVAVSILAACVGTFFGPAVAALVPSLVSDETELGPANAAWATLDSLAFIIGPALAGLLIATGGLPIAFLLNAASFAVIAAVLWQLPQRAASVAPTAVELDSAPSPAAEPQQRGWGQMLRLMAGPLVLDATTSLVGGGVGVLTVVIAVEVLAGGAGVTGYLNAAAGVGGVVAGALVGGLLSRRLVLPTLIGGAVGAVSLLGLALTTNLTLALVAIGVAYGALLILDVLTTTLMQRVIADELRGRALGILQTSTAVFFGAGSLLLPLAATLFGIGPAIAAAGVMVALGSGLAIVLLPPPAEAEEVPLAPARERVLHLPIFDGLPLPSLEAIARQLTDVVVRAGEVVIRHGEPSDRFYVVSSGAFRVTHQGPADKTPRFVRRLGPGEVFGEIGLLTGAARSATVTAEQDGQLLALDRSAFLQAVTVEPGLRSRLLGRYPP